MKLLLMNHVLAPQMQKHLLKTFGSHERSGAYEEMRKAAVDLVQVRSSHCHHAQSRRNHTVITS